MKVFSHRLAGVAILAMALSACGGGSHGMPGGMLPPGGSTTQGAAQLVVSGTIDGSGPYLLAHKRRPAQSLGRRSAQALSLKSVSVTGELFPGDAGQEPIINTISIPVPAGAYSAKVSFSNVPVHNNQWVLLTFTGVASDGSQIALGELAGLVNVTASPTTSATLTQATSDTFQVFATMVQVGDLSTFDLDNSPTLATTLTTDITATGVKVDPTTKVFTSGGLVSILNSLEPKFERDLTINSSPVLPGTLTLTRDWTNASEVNFAREGSILTNLDIFGLGSETPTVAPAWGSLANCDLVSGNPTNIPPSFTIVPFSVAACFWANPGGSMALRNVYGGHLIVGETNNVSGAGTLFSGGHLSIVGEKPGPATYSITDAATSASYTVNDPAGFAFGPTFWGGGQTSIGQQGGFFMTQPNYGAALGSDTSFTLNGVGFSSSLPSRAVPKTAPYGATAPHNIISVDTFNAWNVPSADMEICGGITCFPSTAIGTQTIVRPFADAGTKLTYFNWKPGGTITHITAGTGLYNLTFSAAGLGTLTSTTPTALVPDQGVTFAFGFTMPSDFVTVLATDATTGAVYSGEAQLPAFSGTVTLNNAQTVKIKQIEIEIHYTGSAGVQQLMSITASPTF